MSAARWTSRELELKREFLRAIRDMARMADGGSLSAAQRAALTALAVDFDPRSKVAYPGYQRVADRLGRTRRQAIRMVAALVEKGIVRKVRRGYGNAYLFPLLPARFLPESVTSDDGDTCDTSLVTPLTGSGDGDVAAMVTDMSPNKRTEVRTMLGGETRNCSASADAERRDWLEGFAAMNAEEWAATTAIAALVLTASANGRDPMDVFLLATVGILRAGGLDTPLRDEQLVERALFARAN